MSSFLYPISRPGPGPPGTPRSVHHPLWMPSTARSTNDERVMASTYTRSSLVCFQRYGGGTPCIMGNPWTGEVVSISSCPRFASPSTIQGTLHH